VETGGCPHTAILGRLGSINRAARSRARTAIPDLDLVLVESGGDNSAAQLHAPEMCGFSASMMIDFFFCKPLETKSRARRSLAITRSDLW